MSSADDAASAPTGRERTIDALVVAAIELFGDRGPDAVSLREIASRAGVNYGLIHQYVGTKDDLIRLVLTRLSQQSSDRLRDEPAAASIARLLGGTAASPSLRMLTWALLQHREAPELLAHSPAIDAITEGMMDHDSEVSDTEARQRAVAVMATVLGWQLFGQYLRATSGLGEDHATEIAAVLADMLGPTLDPPR